MGLCLNCDKEVKNKYCSVQCQRDYEHKQYIEKWLKGEISGKRGKTSTSAHLKRYIIATRGRICEGCKNTEWQGHPIPLDLEHIDGNWENNKENNLRLLCLNCHGLTPTYKSKNRLGRPRSKYYRGL